MHPGCFCPLQTIIQREDGNAENDCRKRFLFIEPPRSKQESESGSPSSELLPSILTRLTDRYIAAEQVCKMCNQEDAQYY